MQKEKFPIFRWAAIIAMLVTFTLATVQLVSYSRIRNNFPLGLHAGNVPIGGLNQIRAAERLYTVFRSPVEIKYAGQLIHIRPAVLGFEPQVDRILAVADNQRVSEPYWLGYWNFLWDRNVNTVNIPLTATYDKNLIREYLRLEIGQRYDTPPTPPRPVPGTTRFEEGIPGSTLDLDRATLQVIDALHSPTNRRVNLSMETATAPRPALPDLEIMLQQIIDLSGFDGVVEVYMQDLSANRSLSLAYQANGTVLQPNIAFSSWSLVKIPLMVSVFRYIEEPYPARYISLMEEMVQQSENASTDELARLVIDPNLSPLIVTADMQKLGLENSFWAGHFNVGAPLLQRFETTANQRDDVNTNPDIYNQTTAADMTMIMEDIYQCAELGGGALLAAFPEELTQADCVKMVDILSQNRIGILIQAGVPSGITVAHKHGWAPEGDGIVRTMGNSALVFTPGGNYALTILAHHPVQAVFDQVNLLFAELSQAIFNFYNN